MGDLRMTANEDMGVREITVRGWVKFGGLFTVCSLLIFGWFVLLGGLSILEPAIEMWLPLAALVYSAVGIGSILRLVRGEPNAC